MGIRCSIGGPQRKLKRNYPCLMRLRKVEDETGADDVIVLMTGESGSNKDYPANIIGRGIVVASNVATYPVGYQPEFWNLVAFEDYAGCVTLENK